MVALKLLPRGDGAKKLAELCQRGMRCRKPGVPFASFMPAVAKANALMEEDSGNDPALVAARLRVVDCGRLFLPKRNQRGAAKDQGSEEVIVKRMPDRLHPNAMAHAKMLHECLQPHLAAISRNISGAAGLRAHDGRR